MIVVSNYIFYRSHFGSRRPSKSLFLTFGVIRMRIFQDLLCAVLAVYSTSLSDSIREVVPEVVGCIEFLFDEEFKKTQNAQITFILREVLMKNTGDFMTGFRKYFASDCVPKDTRIEYESLRRDCKKNMFQFLLSGLCLKVLLEIGAFSFVAKLLDAYHREEQLIASFVGSSEWRPITPHELMRLFRKENFLGFVFHSDIETCHYVERGSNTDKSYWFNYWMYMIDTTENKTSKTYIEILVAMNDICSRKMDRLALYLMPTGTAGDKRNDVWLIRSDNQGNFFCKH